MLISFFVFLCLLFFFQFYFCFRYFFIFLKLYFDSIIYIDQSHWPVSTTTSPNIGTSPTWPKNEACTFLAVCQISSSWNCALPSDRFRSSWKYFDNLLVQISNFVKIIANKCRTTIRQNPIKYKIKIKNPQNRNEELPTLLARKNSYHFKAPKTVSYILSIIPVNLEINNYL